MKFRRTSAGLGLVLSGALLLGACTSPDAGESQTPTNNTTESGSAQPSAAPSASGDAAGGAPSSMHDVGITETKDAHISYTAAPAHRNV
mgnify:CR=1 FL=1